MAARHAAHSTLDALPDELLGRVLALAGREAGLSTALVSRRWNRTVFAEPALWRDVVINSEPLAALTDPAQQERWFACKLRLLERVGPLVQSCGVRDHKHRLLSPPRQQLPGAWSIAQLLQLLHPSVLYELIIDCGWPEFPEIAAALELPPATAAQRTLGIAPQLRRLSGLETLALHCYALSEQEVQACASFTRLFTLGLSAALGLPACVADVVAQLPAYLTFLQLEGPHMPPGTMQAVQRHTALQHLQLYVFESTVEDPRPLTALRRLTQLCLVSGASAGASHQLPVVLPPPGQFSTALRCFEMAVNDLRAPPPSSIALQMEDALVHAVEFKDTTLTIEAVSLPSLERLLMALLPPSLGPLSSLQLCRAPLSPAAMQFEEGAGGSTAGALLAPLRMLSLQICAAADSNWDGALSPLLSRAFNLQSLELLGCLFGSPILACVLNATGLTSLQLAWDQLMELPEGPVLAGLAKLNLSGSWFPRLPPALSAATGLTSLRLDGNEDLELETDDLALLQRMPRLSKISLSASAAERAPQALRDWLGPRLVVVADDNTSDIDLSSDGDA